MTKHWRPAPGAVPKIMITLAAFAIAIGALWWMLFALKPYSIQFEQLQARYAHATQGAQSERVQLGPVESIRVGDTTAWSQALRFRSFDGALVLGRITYPTDSSDAAGPGAEAISVL